MTTEKVKPVFVRRTVAAKWFEDHNYRNALEFVDLLRRRGELRSFVRGGYVYVYRADLERFIKETVNAIRQEGEGDVEPGGHAPVSGVRGA